MFTVHAPKRGTCKGQVKNKLPQAIFAELFQININILLLALRSSHEIQHLLINKKFQLARMKKKKKKNYDYQRWGTAWLDCIN